MSRRARVLPWCVLLSALTAGCPGAEPVDGGLDAASDAPGCTASSECDDGRFCNGLETCEGGTCQPGTLPDCDDGVACTADRCSEGRGRCLNEGPDEDGDGYGTTSCAGGNDCDDADPRRFPGNFELCDAEGHDEDCFDDSLGGIDEDGDGFVSAACCFGTSCGPDCDDARSTSRPDALEVCNGLDDDCDGMIDEGLRVAGFVDADADGFGGTTTATACVGSARFTVEPGDCDDDDVDRSPGVVEVCDGADNDCDPDVDEDAAAVDWFVDADGDGFGARGTTAISSCTPITGRARNDRDCDDGTSAVSPRAAETCNGLDDDCNGAADFAVAPGDFEDDDGDLALDRGCAGGTDCDDGSAAIGPGDAEICDGRDNDCDTRTDEGAATSVFFRDGDGDGFGTDASGVYVGCMPPAGWVARGGDCDDADPTQSPAIEELCDGRDVDCDGSVDEDATCALGGNCVDGACRGGPGCEWPFLDCDGDGASCEVDARTSITDCGDCGRACGTTGTTAAACEAGSCRLTCAAGRQDCDGDPTTGCEASTANDPTNCGACGRRCDPRTGDAFACVMGACTLPSCRAGHRDCDGRTENGCETSAASCPSCGPFGADCDGDGACEDLAIDSDHCGVCGRVCAGGGECLGGRCDHIVELDVGNGVSCGRYQTGRVVCWGGAASGVRGPATPAYDGAPVPLVALGEVVQLSLGHQSACAVGPDGAVVCWGSNADGILARPPGTLPSSDVPVAIPLPSRAVEVGVGRVFACALLDTGQVYCWGTNGSRALLDTGLTTDLFLTPIEVALYAEGPPRPDDIAVGEHAVCGVVGSFVFCSGGAPNAGITGGGEGSQYIVGVPVLDLTVGGAVACARIFDGSVRCFGSNNGNGALGIGSTTPSYTNDPLLATELGSAHDAVAIQWTTCGVSAGGVLRCVGDNQYAMTGDAGNTTLDAVTAVPVTLPRGSVLARSGNTSHLCAVDPDGGVWCWGVNSASQCGQPSSAFVRTPTRVGGL